MALDPEEYKKRRQERNKKRSSRQRKTFLRLAIAGAVIVTVLAVILVIAWPKNSDSKQDSTLPTDPETVIRIAAAGDLDVTERTMDPGNMEYDFTDTFIDVAPVLADADLTVLNFEGNLYGEPYGTDRSAPQSLMTSLKNAGVDMIQLANSYSIYHGPLGLSQTVAGIKAAGMTPLGAYSNPAEAAAGKGYTIRTVKGIKIAFVAFTKGMDGMALTNPVKGCVNLLYTDYTSDYHDVDEEGIQKVLSRVAKEKPDLTVALLHWGSVRNDDVSDSQKEIRKLLHQNGVDAIIGTHPNFLREMTLEDGKFVAYSLGKFYSDAQESGSEYSVILELEIAKNQKTGDTRIKGFRYTPIFTVAEEGQPLRVVRLDQAMAEHESSALNAVLPETYGDMVYAKSRIDARINPPKK